uniref:Protein kinase domain-containing protein n=1 Tax=Amphiprion ocellaris TaxID=80972 RepID=A0AAQ5YIW4_AMPOC
MTPTSEAVAERDNNPSFVNASVNMAKNLGITKGSTLGNCHIVEDIIGEGGFGVVAKCRNTDTNKTVAIKINKSEAGILQQAVEEIAILKRLRCLNPDTCNIVRWDGFFFHKENICMTFELLDQSLYHYLQEQHTRGLTMGELKPILHQLATALAHLHSTEIVHADLKPVNVMVVNRHQHPIQVKLIDFGLACPVSEVKQGACFGTVWYSAPEMLLGVPFKESFDMWSLGLIMAELILGCHLYPGKTVYDVLRFMVETQDTRNIKLKSLDEIENTSPSMSAASWEERTDSHAQHPAPALSPVSWVERVDFNDQSPSQSLSAASWEKRADFVASWRELVGSNAQSPVQSSSAMSWEVVPMDFKAHNPAPSSFSSAASLEACVGLSAQRLASSPTDMSWGEKIETSSQPEQVVIEIMQVEDDIVESTPSLTAVSFEDCPAETRKENISWWRRIKRIITRAFRRKF